MKQITLFFAVQVLRRKSRVYILKVPPGDDDGILNRGKTIREIILKNISVCEIYYSKYQLEKTLRT